MNQEPAPGAARRPMRPMRYVALGASGAAAAGVLVWLLTALVGGEDSFTMRGSFDLTDGAIPTTYDGACYGSGGYDDIAAGAPVVVSDETGEVVAMGRLAPADQFSGGVCRFTFEVPDVPDGATFYRVEVSHRGAITVQPDQARSGEVALTLG